jgi:hypothetical protein
VATHRLQRARRRAVGEAVHAIVGQARVREAREDVLIREDEPLAGPRVERDRLVPAMAYVVHATEI